MFTYATKIKAIDPKDGQLKEWFGPNIKAISKDEVRHILDHNGMGYAEVGDRIVSEEDFDGSNKQQFIFWN